jgi:hypothetical protein
MEDIYNSPFTYGPGAYYIPAHNSNYIQPLDYIHPDSIAGQLGLTPAELAPILQEQQELMQDELAQPPSRPDYHYHLTPVELPLPQPQLQPNPTPYDPHSTPAYLAQLGYTPEELEELDLECIREQAELLAIDDTEYCAARRDRELRSEQRGNNMGEAEERTGQAEEMGIAREIGPGAGQDETRWVPNYPTSHSQPAPQTYETPYKPPVDATLHDDDPIDHVDPPDPTTKYQLPTPTAHPELKRHAYEGYGIVDKPTTGAMSYDDDDVAVSNRGDTLQGWYQPQPLTPTVDT